MTKIIRVNSCGDCPHKNYGTYCGKDNTISIHYYVFHKTLPDNCPLENMPKTGFGASFDFLDGESRHFGEEGEDIYTGTEGELITFTNKDG